MDDQPASPQEADILFDIVRFPWIPLRETDSSAYEQIAAGASVPKLVGLAIANGIGIVVLLKLVIGDNPYILLSNDLRYLPFYVTFVFLALFSFLVSSITHFLCFRAIGAKGNLIGHGYVNALSSSNFVLLYIFATISLLITRVQGLDTIVIALGALYLFYPYLVALKTIHRITNRRLVVGFILSVIASIPLYILHLYLLALARNARPYEFYDWRLMAVFGGMLTTIVFISTYMLWQQRLQHLYAEGVPVRKPAKAMLNARGPQFVLSALIILSVAFFVYDLRYPSFTTRFAPYSVTFLPASPPQILYIYTKAQEFGDGPFVLEIWDLTSHRRIDECSAPQGQLLRPNEDKQTLIVSDHRGNTVFDPQTKKADGKSNFLPIHGTYNPVRDEFYHISLFRNFTITKDQQKSRIDTRKIISSSEPIQAVAIHPNGNVLFFVADGQIYVIERDSLKAVDTLQLGGKLRDLAVSPDGQTLYVADALWRRIRIVSLPRTVAQPDS